MIGIGRNSNLTRKIVRRTERNDPKWHVVAIQSIYDLIERSISARGHDDVDSSPASVGSERSRRAALECRVRLDEMPLRPNPAHEMANVLAVGASPMDDQNDVLGWHAGA
jgi:hypothetical protein